MTTKNQPKPRCIVLPIKDGEGPGTGLALHFLLGNVIAAHAGFEECWFGWRTAGIFSDAQTLARYCRGRTGELDLERVSRAHAVQCWVHGRLGADSLELHFFDSAGGTQSKTCSFTVEDQLVGLRQGFINLLELSGYRVARTRRSMMLWDEIIKQGQTNF